MLAATASRLGASQKAARKASLFRRMRKACTPLVTIRYQVPTEAISMMPSTKRATPSAPVKKWAKPSDCSMSAFQIENDGYLDPGADGFVAAPGWNEFPVPDGVLRRLVETRRTAAHLDFDLAGSACRL